MLGEDLARMVGSVSIIPVRHHSPAAAMAVERSLLALRPRLVLIEGPCDATPLIPLLLQPDTRPPVAILAYTPAADEEEPHTVTVPFCDYSPELVAMHVAARLGVPARFFDAPTGFFLDAERAGGEPGPGEEILPDVHPSELFRSLARRFDCSNHHEFWDAYFEMAPTETVPDLITSYGQMVRDWYGEHGIDRRIDRARESWMLGEVARAVQEGHSPETIAIVCGAAHVTGIRAGTVDAQAAEEVRRSQPASLVLIPYSYPRLSEQSGYGAGNRAPAFYQEVWRHRGDWNGAVVEFLLRLMKRMRRMGYSLSLADTIEAQRLAANLAGMRNKPATGLEELRDAATTCYGRGSYNPGRYLDELLRGEEVGSISSMAAKTSLQQEFHDQVKRLGIPFSDRQQDLRLNLTDPGARSCSSFLHRLDVAGVPFARLSRMGTASGTDRAHQEEVDSLQRLMSLREKWQVCWTPATDVRLIELAVYGNSLLEVCRRILRGRLERARGLEETAKVLLQVVTSRMDPLYGEALATCEGASGEEDDFPSLAGACYLLDTITGYHDDQERGGLLQALGERVFARSCLLLPSAARVSQEEGERVREAMKLLHQVSVRRRQRGQDSGLLVERLKSTAVQDGQVYPLISGLACSMLYLDGYMDDSELAGALRLRLSRGEEPVRGAQFVEGLFGLNRTVVVRNRAIVASLGEFLCGLDREAFLAVLPVLRRSLADLNRNEMGYLASMIGSILEVDSRQALEVVAGQEQLEELSALDQELGELFS